MNDLLSLPVLENSLLAWVAAVIALGVSLTLLVAARKLVARYHRRFTEAKRGPLILVPLLVLSRTSTPFFAVLALFLGALVLELGPRAQTLVSSITTIALFLQAGIWAGAIVSAWVEDKRSRNRAANREIAGSLGVIGIIVNGVIWVLVLLLTLDNLGVDITALVAGLGIGGIAVALAVQNIFGDLFASLSITLDRPFVVGDFLNVGDMRGTVESIGIKSTRLRSVNGEQIVMSNADLLGSRVRNYGRMMERRVVFATSVTYETPVDVLERIPGLIRSIVESQPDTRFDRSHFAKHAAASLDFETVYFVESPDYHRYMDIQQSVNLQLHAELDKLGVEFAYPTQKLYVARMRELEAA